MAKKIRKPLSTLTKVLLWIGGIVILLVAQVIIFISPITKYLVEKYDVQYTGRQIKMDWAYVNPFTGYLHFDGLKIFECERDSVFFSTEGFSLNFEIFKAFSGEYEVSSFTLTKPWGIVIQDSTQFNFSDLIAQFAPKDTIKDTVQSEPVKFSILNVKIEDGEFHFREKTIPIVYFIKNVNIESTGKRWDNDETSVQFSLESGIGPGTVKGKANLNLKSMDYKSEISVRKFNLNLLAQYLKQISTYGTVRAILDADVKSSGNFNNKQDVDASVKMLLSDFHFGKNEDNDYTSFEQLRIKITRFCPPKALYIFDSIYMRKPYFKFERYDSLDNIQTMFGVQGQKVKAVNENDAQFNLIIELAKYLRDISENLLSGAYTLNRLDIEKGNLMYNDYTPREKFTVAANPFNMSADHIDKSRNHGTVEVHTGLKPNGYADVSLKVYPKNVKDFDLNYHLNKLPLTSFNPFIITFTSFPLDRGTLELKGNWHVNNGIIDSKNHLIMIDPRTGKRVKKNDTKWIPVPLVLAVLRERGNVIDYEIPIKGNLNNPKFNAWDPVLDVVKNVFIKPPTIPYGLHVSNVETKVEKTVTIKWEPNSHTISQNTEKFIQDMSGFLDRNPEAVVHVKPLIHEDKEREHITVYLAKKQYFLHRNHKKAKAFTTDDSLAVEKMPNKEPAFLKYLNARITDSLLFTVQHKSLNVVGEKSVDRRYELLNAQRKNIFISYFTPEQKSRQLKFDAVTDKAPFNGFSLYDIGYKGDFPEELRKSYNKYNDLNDNIPRDTYKKKRRFRDIFF